MTRAGLPPQPYCQGRRESQRKPPPPERSTDGHTGEDGHVRSDFGMGLQVRASQRDLGFGAVRVSGIGKNNVRSDPRVFFQYRVFGMNALNECGLDARSARDVPK